MRFIARFAMRGPFHAAAAAAMLLLGSITLEPLLVLSGAVVALATLRQGSGEGLRVMMIATAMVVGLGIIIGASGIPMLVFCLIIWLPAWLMAMNLGRTQQQAYPLLMAAVLVAAYALAIRLAVDDVGAFWNEHLAMIFERIASQSTLEFSDEFVAFFAQQMHAWTLVSMFCMLVSIVLLARWWQAALFNPGGFGSEFRELSLPRLMLVIAMVAAAALVAAKSVGDDIGVIGDVFIIVVVSFAFQGLALIHHRVKALKLAKSWLVGMYVMLALTPHVVGPVLATTGVADAFGDFRRLRDKRDDGSAEGRDDNNATVDRERTDEDKTGDD